MSTSYDDIKYKAMLVTPEVLRALDELVGQTAKRALSAAEYAGPKNKASHSWDVSFSDQTTDNDCTIESVLKLPNPKAREITGLKCKSRYGHTPEVTIRLRGGSSSGWTVDCDGESKDVLEFRHKFAHTIVGAVPRYSWATSSLGQALGGVVAGMAISAPLYLTNLAKGDAPFTASVASAILSILILCAMFGVLLGTGFQRLYPKFLCTVGEGARRQRVLEGWRIGVAGTIGTLVLGLLTNAIYDRMKAPAAPTPSATPSQSPSTASPAGKP